MEAMERIRQANSIRAAVNASATEWQRWVNAETPASIKKQMKRGPASRLEIAALMGLLKGQQNGR